MWAAGRYGCGLNGGGSTIKDYLSHRLNAIRDVPVDEMNGWLDKMFGYLGGDVWLSKACNAAHPIVRLWNRKDFMATNELVNFAQAVNILAGIDEKWLKRTMKIVAGKNVNNAKGAIFEILALSVFSNEQCTVVPAAASNPGVDGTIVFPGDISLNLSLKYYGMSAAEKNFLKDMDAVYQHFLNQAQKRRIFTATLILQMKKYSEQAKDYAEIKKMISAALERFETTLCADAQNDAAQIYIRPMGGYRFAKGGCSHIFFAQSPLHQNEYKNLRDKLDDACLNLVRQKPTESDTEYNGIAIHLHDNADIDSYQKELQDYLNQHMNLPISFIMLYQPAVTFDHETQTYDVTHTIKPVTSPKRLGEQPKVLPRLTFFLGHLGLDTPQRTLFADNIGIAELRDMYLYQKGEIYEQPNVMADGTIEGRLSMIAPGIRLSTVLPFKGKTGSPIIRPNILETDHLEIT